MTKPVTQTTETAEEAWQRGCRFMRDSLAESVSKVSQGMALLHHDDIREYPLPPYVPPIPKEVCDA